MTRYIYPCTDENALRSMISFKCDGCVSDDYVFFNDTSCRLRQRECGQEQYFDAKSYGCVCEDEYKVWDEKTGLCYHRCSGNNEIYDSQTQLCKDCEHYQKDDNNKCA